jgi:hypothetical protein
MKPSIHAKLPDEPLGDGDLAFQYEPDKYLIWRVSLQGKLNAIAAVCAGASVTLQAAATMLPDQS